MIRAGAVRVLSAWVQTLSGPLRALPRAPGSGLLRARETADPAGSFWSASGSPGFLLRVQVLRVERIVNEVRSCGHCAGLTRCVIVHEGV